MKVISIVPRLPPAIDGVGDYALSIARALKQQFGIDTQFIICDPLWQGDSNLEGFIIHKLPNRSVGSLTSLLQRITKDTSIVFLHMSGYGYAKWAVCDWLVEALQQWKKSYPQTQLITMFHELYARLGKPWQHNFWVSHWQKRIAKNLAILTDYPITNCHKYAEILNDFQSGATSRNVTILPVISGIGEPKERILKLNEKKPRLVIFGQSVMRSNAYSLSHEIVKACKTLHLNEILDIGPPLKNSPDFLDDIPIRHMGVQPAHIISDLLLESRAGFLNYYPARLSKSGIFAAYCSHGMLPVHGIRDVLEKKSPLPNVHYWVPEVSAKISDLQKIADQAHDWYMTHNLESQAYSFSKFMNG